MVKAVKLKDLKKGEWFTRKPIDEPKERQVFIKDFYGREEKNTSVKGGRICATAYF